MAYSQGDAGLARMVLANIQAGTNYGLDVQQAAVRVSQGLGTKADVRLLRAHVGGKGQRIMGSIYKAYQSASRPFMEITRELDVLSSAQASGQSTAAAQARLTQIITANMDRLAKTPAVKKILERAFIALGEQPRAARMFLGAITRGLRMAGMVGTAMAGGFALAEDIVARSGRYHQTVGQIKDLNRALGGDPRAAKVMEDMIRRDIMSQTLLKPNANRGDFMDAVKDAVRESIEAEIKAEAEKEAGSRKKARTLTGAMGIDSGAVLARKAAELGKSVVDLSARERQEAMDDAADGFSRRTGLDLYSNYVNSKMRKLSAAETEKLRLMGPDAQRAKRAQFAREERRRTFDTLEAGRIAREDSATQARAKMTPDQLYDERILLEERRASHLAHRSRHAAWSNDFN